MIGAFQKGWIFTEGGYSSWCTCRERQGKDQEMVPGRRARQRQVAQQPCCALTTPKALPAPPLTPKVLTVRPMKL